VELERKASLEQPCRVRERPRREQHPVRAHARAAARDELDLAGLAAQGDDFVVQDAGAVHLGGPQLRLHHLPRVDDPTRGFEQAQRSRREAEPWEPLREPGIVEHERLDPERARHRSHLLPPIDPRARRDLKVGMGAQERDARRLLDVAKALERALRELAQHLLGAGELELAAGIVVGGEGPFVLRPVGGLLRTHHHDVFGRCRQMARCRRAHGPATDDGEALALHSGARSAYEQRSGETRRARKQMPAREHGLRSLASAS